VVVVDDLDEGLDLAALALSGLAHAAGDLLRVALDSGDESVGEGVGLAAIVLRLDNHDLLAGITTARDDGLSEGGNELVGLLRVSIEDIIMVMGARDVPLGRP
jgi:hypothetical protein